MLGLSLLKWRRIRISERDIWSRIRTWEVHGRSLMLRSHARCHHEMICMEVDEINNRKPYMGLQRKRSDYAYPRRPIRGKKWVSPHSPTQLYCYLNMRYISGEFVGIWFSFKVYLFLLPNFINSYSLPTEDSVLERSPKQQRHRCQVFITLKPSPPPEPSLPGEAEDEEKASGAKPGSIYILGSVKRIWGRRPLPETCPTHTETAKPGIFAPRF